MRTKVVKFPEGHGFLEACMECLAQGFHAALSIFEPCPIVASVVSSDLVSDFPVSGDELCRDLVQSQVHEPKSNVIDGDQENRPQPGAGRPQSSKTWRTMLMTEKRIYKQKEGEKRYQIK